MPASHDKSFATVTVIVENMNQESIYPFAKQAASLGHPKPSGRLIFQIPENKAKAAWHILCLRHNLTRAKAVSMLVNTGSSPPWRVFPLRQ